MTNETPASKDAQLAALRVSVPDSGDAVLSPPLFGDETEYTAKVASSATSVTVRVTPAHPRATVEYLDTEGTAHVDADVEADGHQVTLEDGVTTLEVKVTAEDGRTTQTYTVDIARNQVPSITLVSPAPGEEGADPANGFAQCGSWSRRLGRKSAWPGARSRRPTSSASRWRHRAVPWSRR